MAAVKHMCDIVYVLQGFFSVLSDIRLMIKDIKDVKDSNDGKFDPGQLPPWSNQRFTTLPSWLQQQLPSFDKSSGELMHSQIQSERLLSELVAQELADRKSQGKYKGGFNPVCHYFGYQVFATTFLL